MTRILVSALAAVVIHGAALFFLPFSAYVPGTVSPKDHGIAIQIIHPSPEPEKKADPSPAPDMPPVPRPEEQQPPEQIEPPEEKRPPEEKQPPEPVPDIETPPPPPPEIEENSDPLEITPRKDLMPKTENLTLSAPQTDALPPEPDEPDPVNPETETPDMPSSDNRDPLPRTTPDQDLSETGKAQAPAAGRTASTDKTPNDREPSPDLPHRIEAVPLYKQNPPPRYPGNARRRGHTGTVLLMVFVTGKGTVEQIRVLESSGHDSLDRAAEKAVADWRFEPGTSGGIPTGMWVKIPITFELKK